MPIASRSEQLTTEQLRVLDSLINAHAEAARELGRCTSALAKAREADDRAAFEAAQAECAKAKRRCEALHLAIHEARKVFLNTLEKEAPSKGEGDFEHRGTKDLVSY